MLEPPKIIQLLLLKVKIKKWELLINKEMREMGRGIRRKRHG